MRALRRAWGRVSEPKYVTVVFFAGYVIIAALAVWALTEPPLSLLGDLGPLVTRGIAVMLILGSLLAGYAALPGWWALERLGIGFILLAITGYTIAIVYAHNTSQGSRALQLTGMTVGLVFVVGRAASIWGRDWAPRGARVT